jgi:beta-lactamase regulating signal transducer with metallopeptidase domain
MEAFVAFTQYQLAPALAAVLLHALWQDALLAVAAALVLRAMSRASAAARHDVAIAFLMAMLLVPAITAPLLDAEGELFVPGSVPAALAASLWLLGAAVMLARHLVAWRQIVALDASPSPPLPLYWRARVDEMRKALGIAQAVATRLTADVLVPCTARMLRPVIWLPLSLLTRTPAEQIEALLAHELAHIARRDWLWNQLQCVVEALLFFHPAVWWLARRIRQEREHACDDLAVATLGSPVALAEALVALERERHPPQQLASAATGGTLMLRIARLLSGAPLRRPMGALAIAWALVVSGALLIAEAGVAGVRLPALSVTSTTTGELGPGDYRQIAASTAGKLRFYRASVDMKGVLTEVYQEDGRPRPLTDEVRRWVRQIESMKIPALAQKR